MSENIKEIKELVEKYPQYFRMCKVLLEELEKIQKAFDELYSKYVDLDKQNKYYEERLQYMLAEVKDHKDKGFRIQHWAIIKDLDTLQENK